MHTACQVTTGGRLHFGMLGFGQPDQRQFGGCGAMVDGLPLRVAVRPAPRLQVTGVLAQRAREYLARVAKQWELGPAPQLHLHVVETPPLHVGLGVGTQLGLAVARAVRACLQMPALPISELAAAAGRGRRSAVGTYGFEQGGLIAEAGSLCRESLAPLLSRVPLPNDWRFVLLLPEGDDMGLAGNAEEQAFGRLPSVPTDVTADLCRELFLHLLPAAASARFEEFSASLYRYGRMAGQCFAARQGGPFAGPQLADWVQKLRDAGAVGVGQSSWGPALFAAAASPDHAQELVCRLGTDAQADGRYLCTVAPRNLPATVQPVSADDPELFGGATTE